MANELVVSQCNEISLRDDGDMSFSKFGEIISFANFCKEADFLPKNMSVPQAAIAIAAGKQLGMSALGAIQNIAVINGRPSIWGDALSALVNASGLCEDEYSEEVGKAAEFKVIYHVKRKGRSHEIVRSFGYEDAKRAGLWGKQGPWSQYPTRMLMLRARAFAYRDAFADVLKGCRIREEEEDRPIDITEKGTVSPAPYNKPETAPAAIAAVSDDDGKKSGSILKAAAKAAAAKAAAAKAASEKPTAPEPDPSKGEEAAPPSDGGEDPNDLFKKD